MQPDNNKVITRKDIDNLEYILSFGDPESAIGSIGVAITNKKTSSKHLTQGGIVTETIHDGSNKTILIDYKHRKSYDIISTEY